MAGIFIGSQIIFSNIFYISVILKIYFGVILIMIVMDYSADGGDAEWFPGRLE